MSRIKEIAEGWKNTIFKKEYAEAIAKSRLDVCEVCEFNSKNVKDDAIIKRPDVHCTKCGCPLMSKTRCLSCDCPIQKWKAVKEESNDVG